MALRTSTSSEDLNMTTAPVPTPARAFWIALPEGWQRSDNDPLFMQRFATNVRQHRGALADTGIDVEQVLAAVAGGATGPAPLFAASLYTVIAPADFIGPTVPNEPSDPMQIASQDATDLGVIQASLTVDTLSRDDAAMLRCDDDPMWELVECDVATSSLTCFRRTAIDRTDPSLEAVGYDFVGHAQYIIESADHRHGVNARFCTVSMAIWDELLDYFDAIAATVEFEIA